MYLIIIIIIIIIQYNTRIGNNDNWTILVIGPHIYIGKRNSFIFRIFLNNVFFAKTSQKKSMI